MIAQRIKCVPTGSLPGCFVSEALKRPEGALPGERRLRQPAFLPLSLQELEALGWSEPDILLVSGDAYVDHPSFGVALLGRWLVEHGFRVAILAQPRWEGQGALEDFGRFPRPRLFAGVTAGAIDSMLAHHTAFRKKRSEDAYTPGGRCGARPNRASIVYAGLLRRAYPGLPVVLGGLEASLRRISHYDFWTDSLRRSILLDSKADLLLCGMAEQGLLEAAQTAARLAAAEAAAGGSQNPENQAGKPPREAFRKAFSRASRLLPGAVTAWNPRDFAGLELPRLITLPSHEEMLADPSKLLTATLELEKQVHQASAFLRQDAGERALLLAPFGHSQPSTPSAGPEPENSQRLDRIYDLPFSRLPHPSYQAAIPAWEMIRTSITTHRGCGGGCSFCSLALHQGRRLESRSRDSVLREARIIAAGPGEFPNPAGSGTGESKPASSRFGKIPKWAGSISDVGGPSANMWQGGCTLDASKCARSSCLFPKICPGFKVDQKKAVRLLREVAAQPGVRHVRVASGVRFDMALGDEEALRAYSMEFTGGQLKVAPEHVSEVVLSYMRKPALEVFEKFMQAFARYSRQAGKEQYVVPYLISAFPGCTETHMRELKGWLKKRGWSPKQVQCFIPTPGTVATAMFYCGRDPEGKTIYVARTDRERLRQHHILLD